jgi:hypothetical protein
MSKMNLDETVVAYFICTVFNDAVSSSDYIATND